MNVLISDNFFNKPYHLNYLNLIIKVVLFNSFTTLISTISCLILKSKKKKSVDLLSFY